MRRVRRLGGGAACAVAALGLGVLLACATGSTDTVDDSEAGLTDGSSGGPRDVFVQPKDGAAGSDSSSGGTDSPSGCGSTKVVINEVQTQGTGASDEFVEIYNPTDCAIALDNWKLLYRSKADGLRPAPLVSFAAGTTIPAKTYLWFSAGTVAGTPDGPLTPGMAATDGQVGLVDDADKLVDGVAYGAVTTGTYLEKSAAPSPPSKGSVARKPSGADTDDNSKDFAAAATPTPGVAN